MLLATNASGRAASASLRSGGAQPPEWLYRALVFLYPVLVLFSPLLNLGIGQRRLDEWLVLGFAPFALLDLTFNASPRLKRLCGAYWWALVVLFGVYVFGVVFSYKSGGFSAGNVRLLARPLLVIANMLVLRLWLLRARLSASSVLLHLCGVIGAAGLVGVVAMSQPGLALILMKSYNPGLLDQDLLYRFNMSWRAMSVFKGYDAASMAYAMALVAAIYLYLTDAASRAVRYLWIPILLVTAISIVSSARVGFLAVIVGLVALFLVARTAQTAKTLASLVVTAGLFSVAVTVFGAWLFPDNVTVERFVDALNIFKIGSGSSILERSEGLASVFDSQVAAITYPKGLETFLGFGDDGGFVSDVGYVVLFVKYGLFGLTIVSSMLIWVATRGLKLGRWLGSVVEGGQCHAVSSLIPVLILMFVVGATKGGLYLVGDKTGECFALVLALSIFEVETALKAARSRSEFGHKGVVM